MSGGGVSWIDGVLLMIGFGGLALLVAVAVWDRLG